MITPTLYESLFEIVAYVSVKLNEKICVGQKDLIQSQIRLFKLCKMLMDQDLLQQCSQ